MRADSASEVTKRPPSSRHSVHRDKDRSMSSAMINHLRRYYLTHSWEVVIAPPIRFSVVDFSENRGNHVKVSTSLGLLLAHSGFLGRPVDLLLQERYTTCSSLLPPEIVLV